jgi:hypothetical protein
VHGSTKNNIANSSRAHCWRGKTDFMNCKAPCSSRTAEG